VVGHKIRFSLGVWFSCDEQGSPGGRKAFSSVWVTLDERLTVVGENYLQEGQDSVHSRR